MISPKDREQIFELVEGGFDTELIAFELGISAEELQKILDEEGSRINRLKQEEAERLKRQQEELKSEQSQKTNSKMAKIRKNYYKLYYKRSNNIKGKTSKSQELTEEKLQLLNDTICSIREKTNNLPEIRKDRRRVAIAILGDFKGIQSLPFPLKQAEELYKLVSVEALKKLDYSYSDRIDKNMRIMKGNIAKKLAEEIEVASSNTNDYEAIKELSRKITPEMEKENSLYVSSAKIRIKDRLNHFLQQSATYRLRNDVSDNVKFILKRFVHGDIDISEINQVIDKDAERRMKSAPNGMFALTKQQQRSQVIMQVRTLLLEKGDEYPIYDPKLTIDTLCELSGDSLMAVRTAVTNLITRKKFDEARQLCSEYIQSKRHDLKESELSLYARGLKKEVGYSEIGDMIVSKIKDNSSEEVDKAFMEMLEARLKKENINLSRIKLGKSKDGLNDITLQNVWYCPNTKQLE